MINKVKKLSEVIDFIKPGSKLILPGFYYVGRPETLLEEIYKKGINNLDIVVNDIAFPDDGVGRLVMNDQVTKLNLTFIGTNKEINKKVTELVNSKKIELKVTPQGTLVEQIRAAGSGLGGILTPTGIGTVVAEGKKILKVNGKEYILEEPINGEFSIVRAYKADKYGNLTYRGSARNFNHFVAMAGKYTIAEAETITKKGLDPEKIHTPGIFVNAVVKAKRKKK